jgi:bifunctional DNA-binding transcriptional regulator/antitoxin component of YhaV-PrlF toxin-antitoxin module
MAKVTSKLQVTVPRAIAERFAIRPGTEIEWVPAGDVIRVIPPRGRQQGLSREMRLKLFDQATARQRPRNADRSPRTPPRDRGWTREDLYRNGRAR